MVRFVSVCETCGKRFVAESNLEVLCRRCFSRAFRIVDVNTDERRISSPFKSTVFCDAGDGPMGESSSSTSLLDTPEAHATVTATATTTTSATCSHSTGTAASSTGDVTGLYDTTKLLILKPAASEEVSVPPVEDDDLELDAPLFNLRTDHALCTVKDTAVTVASSEFVIDLLSDDDNEVELGIQEVIDSDDEPILVDFQTELTKQLDMGECNDDDIQSFSDQDSFIDEQQKLHTGRLQPPQPMDSVDPCDPTNLNLATCLVCGADLMSLQSGYKGRLNHIKRCSKKHGVTAKDVRLDDAYELFIDTDAPPVTTSEINPYLRRNNWHGAEPVDSQLLHSSTGTHTGTGVRQDEAAVPVIRPSASSALDLLMAGARKLAAQTNSSELRRCDATATTTQSKPRSVNDVLMTAARNRAKISNAQPALQSHAKGGKRPRYNNSTFRSFSSKTPCPKYKQIPSTDFVVDGFQYASSVSTKNFFLSHFHADHYGGITKNWSYGIIYCSMSTANLVHEQLGVDRRYLHPLPMTTPTVIESANGRSVTVSLLPANHCPGAVMFLFDVAKRVILHVGDFRWNYDIMSSLALLRPFCRDLWTGSQISERRIDDLFLDTTYCDARYSLPTQKECIQAVVTMAIKEVKNAKASKRRLLMLFGAYTIGKEAVYMSVARKLGLRVYVDKRRHRILSALEWSKEDLSLLTTTPEDTLLWVVPLGHVNMKKLVSYQSIRTPKFSRDFDAVVGFRPTGWSMTSSSKNQDGVLGTTTKGNLTVHSVPYSEHSSFPELVECLECLNPKRIIPTVSVAKSQQQVDLLLEHWRLKQSKHLSMKS